MAIRIRHAALGTVVAASPFDKASDAGLPKYADCVWVN